MLNCGGVGAIRLPEKHELYRQQAPHANHSENGLSAHAGRRSSPAQQVWRRRTPWDSPGFRASRFLLTNDDSRCVLATVVRALRDLPNGRAAGSHPHDAHALLHLGPVGDSECTAQTALGSRGSRGFWEHGERTCTGLPGRCQLPLNRIYSRICQHLAIHLS